MTHYKRELRSFDWVLAGLVVLLCGFGVLMITSATGMGSGEAINAAAARVFRSQFVWAGTGLAVMAVFAAVDFEFIGKFGIALYAANIALLGLVLILGKDDAYARWLMLSDFGIPVQFGIQPSEFTKLFMIIYLAKFLDKFHERINSPLVLLAALALSSLPILLIAAQPSLSASAVPLVILLTMLFTAKVGYRYVIIAFAVLVPVLIFLYYDLHSEPHILIDKVFKPYQIQRVMDILYPGDNAETRYQTEQSMAAIASGGLWGAGLFNNTVYVPYAYNDFIVAVVGAEFGFFGMAALLAAVFAVVIKCVIHAWKTPILFGRFLCAGAAAVFAFQTFANVSVATGVLPNTGIVFPFISSGGSSMWINMAMAGLVINVGMKKKRYMFEG
jgi:rod shape determining protein RodA